MEAFFIPEASSPEETESVYASIKKFAEENTNDKITDRRILQIKYHHNGKNHEARVGETFYPVRERAFAILEGSRCYFVCTPNRGVERGLPYLVGTNEVRSITDFDSAIKTRTATDPIPE